MQLLTAMYEDDADFTNIFRSLGDVASSPEGDVEGVPSALLLVGSIPQMNDAA